MNISRKSEHYNDPTFSPSKTLETDTPLVCITKYHPLNPPIKDILKKNWPTVNIDKKLKPVSDKRVVFGHQRLNNLRDILVNSQINYPPTPVGPTPTRAVNPAKVCNNNNFRY
jgi:hypothetical protein